jgi:DNA repair protein RecO (recombination protein O)
LVLDCGAFFWGSRRADMPMPVRESEAIVLRTYSLGEGDLLVSFLSRLHGRLRGMASGARKPKSRFAATLEPLSYVRVWFFERETRDLVRINQLELIESFVDVQRDYSSSLALALASEVTEAVLGEREVAEPNFRLLLLTIRAVRSGTKMPLVLAYFALWIVRLGGMAPETRSLRAVRSGFGFRRVRGRGAGARVRFLSNGRTEIAFARGHTNRAENIARKA